MVYCKVLLKTQDSLLQTKEHELINWTKGSTILGHQMALPEGYICSWISCIYVSTILFSYQFYLHQFHSWLSSVVSTLVPFFATRCIYLGRYIWTQVSCIYPHTILGSANVKLTWHNTTLCHYMLVARRVCLTNMMAYSVEAFQCHLPPQLQINMICILIYRWTEKYCVYVDCCCWWCCCCCCCCCCSPVKEEAFSDEEQQNYRCGTTTTRAIYLHTVLFFSIFQNSYPLHNSTQSPALKCMTGLSSGWTSNEKKNWTHNTLQLSTSLGH